MNKPTHDIHAFLSEKGISLESCGVNNFALNRENSVELLMLLEEKGLPIFGGDVYSLVGGKLTLTYDNWFVDKLSGEDSSEYAARSIRITKQFIENYVNGDAYFAFVF